MERACELIITVTGEDLPEDAAQLAADDSGHWLEQLAKKYPHIPFLISVSAPEPLAGAVKAAAGRVGPRAALFDLLPAGRAGMAAVTDADVICRFSHIALVILGQSADADGGPGGLAQAVVETWRSDEVHWCEATREAEAERELGDPFRPVLLVMAADAARVAARQALQKPKVRARDRLIGAPEARPDGADLTDVADMKSMLKDYNRLNRDLGGKDARQLNKARGSLMPEAAWKTAAPYFEAGTGRLAGLSPALQRYYAAEAYAVPAQKWLLRPLHYILAGSLPVSVLLYELASKLPGNGWGIGLVLYFLVFGIALLVAGIVQLSSVKTRWHEARLTAELTRVSLWWHIAGVRSHAEPTLAWSLSHRPICVLLVARLIDLQAQLSPAIDADETHFVRAEWIGPVREERAQMAAQAGHTQTVWYSRTADKLLKRAALLGRLQIGVFVLAMLVALGAMALDYVLQDAGAVRALIISASVSILPAAAGAIALLRERRGYIALAESYTRMAGVAELTSTRLRHAGDVTVRQRRIEQFGQAAISEAATWLIVNRQRPLGPT